MPRPVLTQCCFCCTLRQGTITIGIIQIVVTSLIVIWGANVLGSADEESSKTLRIILIILLVACIVDIVFAVLLIYGAASRRPALLIPWLVLKVISTILGMSERWMTMVSSSGSAIGIGLVSLVIYAAISCYLILVVCSYKRQLLSKPPQPHDAENEPNNCMMETNIS